MPIKLSNRPRRDTEPSKAVPGEYLLDPEGTAAHRNAAPQRQASTERPSRGDLDGKREGAESSLSQVRLPWQPVAPKRTFAACGSNSRRRQGLPT